MDTHSDNEEWDRINENVEDMDNKVSNASDVHSLIDAARQDYLIFRRAGRTALKFSFFMNKLGKILQSASIVLQGTQVLVAIGKDVESCSIGNTLRCVASIAGGYIGAQLAVYGLATVGAPVFVSGGIAFALAEIIGGATGSAIVDGIVWLWDQCCSAFSKAIGY